MSRVRVRDLGFQGLGFGWGLRCGVSEKIRCPGSRFRVWGLGSKVWGLGKDSVSRVQGSGLGYDVPPDKSHFDGLRRRL